MLIRYQGGDLSMAAPKKNVLFVCTHNSFRSQIAEGYLRAKFGDRYEAYSAGTEPTTLDPRAVLVMAEIGIDISGQTSNPLLDFFDRDIDIAVTVCDTASGACPMVPGAGVVFHQSFPDHGDCDPNTPQCLNHLRNVRNSITGWIDQTFV